MKIGIDLDGVCYPFEEAIRYHLLTATGIAGEHMPAPTQWHFYEEWGLTVEEFNRHCHDAANLNNLFLEHNPYPGVADALQTIHAVGHTIHVITARDYGLPGVAQQQTVQWLRRHGIPFDTITFSRDKTVVRTDWYIDDNTNNVIDVHATGANAVIMDQPWNRDAPPHHPRVSSMTEYADMIMGAS